MTATIVATAVPVAIVTVARARIAAPVVIVMTASAPAVRRAPKQPPAKEHLNNEW